MLKTVYLSGSPVRLDPGQVIGKGGEADIYAIGGDQALKIFKQTDHPDLSGFPDEQDKARKRLEVHQQKLRVFPKGLPAQVVVPQALATDKNGKQIYGYSMQFLRGAEVLWSYAQKSFRQKGVINQMVVDIFLGMHPVVKGIHQKGVEIGDFNDLNIMVLKTQVFFIDADSYQYGGFYCMAYTVRFVDPLLCTTHDNAMMLSKPYQAVSDWYAFCVMMMSCLLYVDPYGGVYKPKDPKKRIAHTLRPMHRITVFDPEVVYPKPATPFCVLSDDLLHYFHQVFKEDKRGEFPLKLLENLRWTQCTNCGLEHARGICPVCQSVSPTAKKEVTRITGKVVAHRVFITRDGIILNATVQAGRLRYLYHENGKYLREGSQEVISGPLDPQMRFRIKQDTTLVAKANQVLIFDPQKGMDRLTVDGYRTLPIFDTNAQCHYWLVFGQLMRDGEFGPEHIGDVLQGQTLFWVGPSFGFGFYQAGGYSVYFVFKADGIGINDTVKIPPVHGQLIDSTCVFSTNKCWFFISVREGSQILNRCYVVRSDGQVEATAQAVDGDGSWLGTIRGKLATGDYLFAATDEGIVRVGIDSGKAVKTTEFPDTESYVNADSILLLGSTGIVVVGRKEIWELRMN